MLETKKQKGPRLFWKQKHTFYHPNLGLQLPKKMWTYF